MASVSMKTTLNASADEAWQAIRDFGGIDQLVEGIVECSVEGSGVGAVRTLAFADGGEIQERLESLDDAARTLSYSIIASELPMEGYLSTMAVRALGEGTCELSWSSTFEPKGASEAEARALVEGVYSAGFAGLKKLLEGD